MLRRILSALVCTTLSAVSVGETLLPDDWTGKWIGTGSDEMLSLKIAPELTQVIWIDSAGDGEVRRDVISGDDVKVVGDTLIVVNRDQDGVGQKLVLSGYRSGAGSLLFGTRFLYGLLNSQEGHLYNGIPITLEKAGSRGGYDLAELAADPGTRLISTANFEDILAAINSTPGVQSDGDGNMTWYQHPSWGAIAVTHPSNPAYPAVLFIMVPFGDNGEPLVERLQLVGRYAGDGEAFSGWRSRVGERLRREWKEAHPLINREGAEESEPEVPVN